MNILFLGLIGIGIGLSSLIFNISFFNIFIIFAVLSIIYNFYVTKKIKLITIWIFAFVYFIYGEHLIITIHKDPLMYYPNFIKVENFFILAFSMTLLGYYFMISYYFKNKKIAINKNSYNTKYLKFVYYIYLTIIMFIFIYSNINLTNILMMKRTGMVILEPASINDLLFHIIFMILLIFPSIYIFMRNYLKSKIFNISAVIINIFIFVYLVAIGTRFYVGYFIVGILNYYIIQLNKSKEFIFSKKVLIIIIFIILIIITMNIMRVSRNISMQNTNILQVIKEIDVSKIFSYEALYYVNTSILNAQEHHSLGLTLGRENAFILYFWVPRIFWHNKPVMTGYWIMRKITYGRYSAGHSFSGGFSFAALVDFGYWGGIIFCLFYGILIAFFEYLFKSQISTKHPIYILNSAILFTVFFMMRSFQTALINLILIIIIGVIPFFLILPKNRLRN